MAKYQIHLNTKQAIGHFWDVRFLDTIRKPHILEQKVWFLNLLASNIQSIWQSNTISPFTYQNGSVFGYPLHKHFIYNNNTLIVIGVGRGGGLEILVNTPDFKHVH